MKIIIATGIYPPAIGGPAQYAKNLQEEFAKLGHQVLVLTYRLEHYLPTGIRHAYFFGKIFFASLFFSPDFILALDTFSVGLPSVCAAKILNKKIIIRTGGDFLWEGYVERTGNLVLLREFYGKIKSGEVILNLKEQIIFRLTKWTVRNSSVLVFSTDWQKEIWREAYGLDSTQVKCEIKIIENYFGEKVKSEIARQKNFIAGTRKLKWKNLEKLEIAFAEAKNNLTSLNLKLDLENSGYEHFLEKIRTCYAVILVSLGDISPNLVLDALRFNKPVILTQETGLRERLGDAVIWVDPENQSEITEKIMWLAEPANYQIACEKAQNFTFTHTWREIAGEFIALAEKI